MKRKFAGEEFEDELGKNTVAFQWRDYDPAIGRFGKIDRFAEKYVDVSPYSYTANNPMAFREVKGDSIRTYFYDKEGNRTNNIPKAVQKMFNEEFGINVGYNSETSMLYFDGEVDSELSQSESATGGLVSALKDTNTGRGKKGAKKHGTIKFGYNLEYERGGKVVNGGWEITGGNYNTGLTHIDLADFDSDGNSLFLDFSSNLNPRANNMARTFEHEYFGHGGPRIGGSADGGHFSMGRAVETTNIFRRQRGLSERLHYGGATNVIFFGNTSSYSSKRAQRKAVQQMTTSTNQLFMKIRTVKRR